MEDKGTKLSLHSISSLFSDTWRMYQERFSTLIEIVLLPVLLMTLGYVLLALGRPFSIGGGLIILVGWMTFILAVFAVISSLRNNTGVDASYKATMGVFWPLVWVVILEVIAGVGAFFLLILPGIWLSLALSFVSYVFVVEHRRGFDALRQSKDYIKGYWWAFLGRALLIGVISWVITVIVQAPVEVLLGRTAASIFLMLITLFIVPFTAIYNYNLYENFRELKPELVASPSTKKGTGFIKTSAVVGIIAPILVIIALVIWIYPLLQTQAMR